MPENIISTWRNKKSKYNRLADADLRVLQGGRDDSEQRFNYVNELYESKKAELLTKDERIRFLEEEVASFGKLAARNVPFQDITQEAKISYTSIAGIGFSNRVQTDFNKMDTISLFEIKLKEGLSDDQRKIDIKNITNWLKVRVKDSTIQVKEVN